MKVLVGLSGGVDSTVAALILKEQGHEVIGATMSIWGKNGMALKTGAHDACYGPKEKEDIEAASKIAKELGIPYHVFDCVEQYEKIVLENFKSEYLGGRTPNPCIWCNALIKFGALPKIAKLQGIDFDKFATGHYARVEENNGRYLLKRGVVPNKDQSYFLYRLKQEQLSQIILPLGGYSKDKIRNIARNAGLDVADKPDSQDFYDGDYNELLGVTEKEGNIVDVNGKVLGKHKGIWNFTIGQRKGIGVSAPEPMYVLELRKNTNEVVIGPLDKTFNTALNAINLNWIGIENLKEERKATAKFRSTQQPSPVTVFPTNDGIKVIFDNPQKSIAIGQSVVLYDEDTVLGGGIIDSVE
ncbi:tRNA 2-thiouridine(34) synthase MnmA [bacterium]|nr:tRNA 2-thiouridine(34) synthase MnmA [bacterium]